MSLRRDFRRLLRAATKLLNAHAKRMKGAIGGGDNGKGADALGKALGELQADPTLAALDTTPPHSYAAFGDLDPKLARPTSPTPEAPHDPPPA